MKNHSSLKIFKFSNRVIFKLNKMSTRFKPKFNIKKGDNVVVITGEDKDLKKPRKVMEVLLEKGRVLVEGVNIVTKHTKPTSQNTKGGIVKIEAPINISNVMLWDAKTAGPTKVKRTRENGKLIRVSKKSGEAIK
jgi:large subunit ribosomal protein L24